ncbi:MAG: hypothetical protein R3B06_06500 [Kofleriaceae bacterium]
MFLGHFATGLAAKPLAPRMALPALLVAPQVLDLAWPVLVATGVEQAHLEPGHLAASPLVLEHMPYSHSLVFALGWALGFALGYLALTRDRRGAAVGAALVVGHWLLDWIAHGPDMQLWPGGARHGLGLWGSLPGTLAAELGMFAVGATLYTRATRATGPIGRWGWPALAAVLTVGFVVATVGAPPPSIDALLAFAAAVLVVVVVAAVAIDRQRPPRARRELAPLNRR